MAVSTHLFFDKFHPSKNGTCSVSVRVTHNRVKKYYKTDVKLTPEDFDKVMGSKPRGSFKDIALDLQSKEARAREVIDKIPSFSFAIFEKRYLIDKAFIDTLDQAYDTYIRRLRSNGQISTAITYECAQKSLGRFKPKAKFTDITPPLLQEYEKWMLVQKCGYSTISMYLRTLRCLFNNAVTDGELHKDHYPFGKRRYEIPTGVQSRKALTLKQIADIYYYKAIPGSNTEKFRDLWLFSYFANGINPKDISLLKYENLKADFLEFYRAKTQHSKKNKELIRVPLVDDLKFIIERHGNKDKSSTNYIFPVLTPSLSPERVYQLIQQFTHLINDHIKIVKAAVGIDANVTSYTARHSFSTIQMRNGESTQYISKALGHSDLKTTQNYLAGFEDEQLKKAAKALTAFKTDQNK